MINLPVPQFTRTRQKRLEQRREDLLARAAKRDAGSSSVRMRLDNNTRAATYKIRVQRVRLREETTKGRNTTPETPQSAHPADILGSGHEIHPPVPPGHGSDGADGEPPPPLPPMDDIIEDPSSLPGPAADDFGPTNPEGPPPGPDLDDGILPPDEGLLPLVPDPDGDPPLPGYDSGSGSDSSPSSDEDESPPPLASDGDRLHLTLEKMKTNQQFIAMAREATLASQLSPGELQAFQNPQEDRFSPSDNHDLHLSVDFYISSLDHAQSQKAYDKSRSHVLKHFPSSKMLSYDQVKRRVSNLSGIVTWKHDMCFNSCVGFTGPFEQLADCPYCAEPRYDQRELRISGGKKKVPRKVFTTFTLGPQIQARWRNSRMAQDMSYRREKTRNEFSCDRDSDDYTYDDVFCGSDYLGAVENGTIGDHCHELNFGLTRFTKPLLRFAT